MFDEGSYDEYDSTKCNQRWFAETEPVNRKNMR